MSQVQKFFLLKNIISLIGLILHIRFQGAAVDASLQVKSEAWARKTNHLSYPTVISIALLGQVGPLECYIHGTW